MVNFMDELETPKVGLFFVQDLEAPLSIDKIGCPIRALQTNKAPGPDVFSVEFYITFCDKLALILLSVYNESLESGTLPPSLTQALIMLLLKKDNFL